MNIKEKDKLFKEMLKRYGHILSKYTIYDICLKGDNKFDIEIEICNIYIDELEYEK